MTAVFLDPDEDDSKIREKFQAAASAKEAYNAAYLDLLPPNERVKEEQEYYEEQAKDHLVIVRLSQYFNHLELSAFTDDPEKLTNLSIYKVIGLEEFYNLEYHLDNPEFFTSTAIAKNSRMKSYALGMVGSNWIICESTEASQTISLPVMSGEEVSCGQDSIQVEGEGDSDN